MPRKKTLHLVYTSEAAMIGGLNRHAELTLRLKTEDAAHAEQIAALNTVHTEQTQAMRDELAQLETSIHLYCLTHRAALFPEDKKSKEFPNAILGFRLNPPSVATVVPKESQDTIARRLDSLEWGEPYVNWKAALNKEALLRDRLIITAEQLAQAGLRFEQAETFYIEPKSDEAPRITKPAEPAEAA